MSRSLCHGCRRAKQCSWRGFPDDKRHRQHVARHKHPDLRSLERAEDAGLLSFLQMPPCKSGPLASCPCHSAQVAQEA